MRLLSRLLQQASSLPLQFVPPFKAVADHDVNLLTAFIKSSKKLVVLTGAGLSTESGIRDYRSENVGLYATSSSRPIQHKEFISSATGRQRYWARNYVGWPQFASYEPNINHRIIAEYEHLNGDLLHWLITQNVDALHTKAGSQKITELHGCTHRVICLNCESVMLRWDLQKLFQEMNPNFKAEAVEQAPDGDVILPEKVVKTFQVPPCPSCGGVLKPDVIFFGDNVKRSKVEFVDSKVCESDALLVLGSSLYVYSAYRFIRRAHDLAIPIAIVNIGETRADKLATLRISARCGEILPLLNL